MDWQKLLLFFFIVDLGVCDQDQTDLHDMSSGVIPCALEMNTNGGFKQACGILLFNRKNISQPLQCQCPPNMAGW